MLFQIANGKIRKILDVPRCLPWTAPHVYWCSHEACSRSLSEAHGWNVDKDAAGFPSKVEWSLSPEREENSFHIWPSEEQICLQMQDLCEMSQIWKNWKGLPYRNSSIWEIFEKNIENQCISLMTLLVIFKKCEFFPKNTWIFLERFAIDNRHLVEKLLKKIDFFVYFLHWWNEKVNNLVTNLF